MWKHPVEDFNIGSTLIVGPSEVALFIDGGKIVSMFETGRFILETNNYPFLSTMINLFSGGVSSFHCLIVFVKKTESKELKWGTVTPIDVRDKQWGIITTVRARAVYKLLVTDPIIFVKKLLGINYQSKNELDYNNYIGGLFSSVIYSMLSEYINSLDSELIGINSRTAEISEIIYNKLHQYVSKYGLECTSFNLISIDLNREKYDEIDKSQIASIAMKRDAKAKKEVVEILGDQWGKQQTVDILKASAENPGNGGVGAGIVMSAVGISELSKLSNSNNNDSFGIYTEKLKAIRQLFDDGLINEEEYNKLRKSVIDLLMEK